MQVEEGSLCDTKGLKCGEMQGKAFPLSPESCLFDAKREFENKKCLQKSWDIAFIPSNSKFHTPQRGNYLNQRNKR